MKKKLKTSERDDLALSTDTMISLGSLSPKEFNSLIEELEDIYFLMQTKGGKKVIRHLKEE
ncbi:hypothetical protein [Bacillus safensis]|uniref:hypothetical protein n=1 Tax=Bacillus safensis TaxID=561879 RepID=UPI0024962500|nr:hypothetical protein [Bacillus safensis]GMG80718.1 hypothetical protein ShirakiTA10_36800 [Bacillus safensis]